MSLPLATSVVVLASILGNRILAVGIGVWFGVPATLMLSLLIALDILQIPLFYQLYDHGSSLFDGIPAVRKWLSRDLSQTRMGKLAKPLGGLGVMMVAALPTLGGGIWTSVFVAYGLRMDRRSSYLWIMAGSLLSYFTLYWILDMLIRTARYFIH